jgi:hypothetical protein
LYVLTEDMLHAKEYTLQVNLRPICVIVYFTLDRWAAATGTVQPCTATTVTRLRLRCSGFQLNIVALHSVL